MRIQDANGDGSWGGYLFQSAQEFGNTLWDYTQGTAVTNGERFYCCSAFSHFQSLQKMIPGTGGTWTDFNGTSCYTAADPIYEFDWVSSNESRVDQGGINC